jgi:hypothetical protein
MGTTIAPAQGSPQAVDARKMPLLALLRARSVAAAVAAACALVPVAASGASAAPMADDGKAVCAYSAHHISTLDEYSRLVHHAVDCALVYNDSAQTWQAWETPWFLHHGDPDLNWARWATAPGTQRRLVITQNLFPAELNRADWRTAGARGDYAEHARSLARNLVAAGLGDSVIRLAHEANGNWYPDSIGDTPEQYDEWRQFWRQTVLAMRSVPGANFRFDWCVNAAYRAIPLVQYYPGDDVVDFVGVDAYDSGIAASTPVDQRWPIVYGRDGGVRDVLRFAKAHGKPLTIPEWGVAPPSKMQSGGDDPGYVHGIAAVVRDNTVAYHSYFYKYEWATQLAEGPRSLAAYRQEFGADAGASDGGGAPQGDAPVTPPPADTPPAAPPGGAQGAGASAPPPLSAGALADALTRALARRRARADGLSLRVRARAPSAGTACLLVAARGTRRHVVPCGDAAVVVRSGPILAAGTNAFDASAAAWIVLHARERMRGRRSLSAIAIFVPRDGGPATSLRRVKLRPRRR